ncbi:Phospholipase B1, membrane-associated [Toxocara canis]|uniref:Phospholipase B1, membrane-associated n=1 Tax=Toxocara canis TaxID=6265 RepID=A0A0B2UP57_TOXCA|nr:Phospholipase B1, membrane-associated [Toxocara canis]
MYIHKYRRRYPSSSKNLFFQVSSLKGAVCVVACFALLLLSIVFMCNKLISSSAISRVYKMATSVHNVHPSQIGVVAALGDSFSVGYGASPDDVRMLNSHPQFSFSMGLGGVLKEHITIPNILLQLGASLVGYSTNDDAGLNFAFPGALSSDLQNQAVNLAQRFAEKAKSSKWKLLTIFIGLNDMAHECFHRSGLDVLRDRYKSNLEGALDVLSGTLTRTIVSVVSVPNIATLFEAEASATGAQMPCFNVDTRQMCDMLNGAIESIIKEGRYERDDFTLVQQPLFSSENEPPKTATGVVDRTLFASDGFHLSQKGQSMYAAALWNNMLEPVGSKSRRYPNYPYRLRLPDEEFPYIRTSNNSNNCDGKQCISGQEKFIEF